MAESIHPSPSPHDARPPADVLPARRSRSWWIDAGRRFRAHRLASTAAWVLAAITVAVVVGPWLLGDPNRIDLLVADQPPSWAHPMGTDKLGRDEFTRVLVGGRLTLSVAGSTVLVAVVLGVAVGATAGFVGGWVDNLLMRVVDVFYSLPGLFVVIVVVAMLGASFTSIVVSIALLMWMNTARLVRASFLSLTRQDFVEAARALGIRPARIAVVHVLPNAMGPVIISATLGIAAAILIESALSFLGLGFQPPRATWGGMLQQAQNAVVSEGHWWRGLFPGLFIFATVLSVNFVGDGLRDAFDAKRAR